MPFQVSKIVVAGASPKQRTQIEADRKSAEAQGRSIPVEFLDEPPPDPGLKNLEYERDDVRRGLDKDKANICINVKPGDTLGELYVCVQYEGPKGQHDLCLAGQNELAAGVGDWLRELFGDTETTWNVIIETIPCKKADEPYRIVEHARRLETDVAGETRATVDKTREVQVATEVERGK